MCHVHPVLSLGELCAAPRGIEPVRLARKGLPRQRGKPPFVCFTGRRMVGAGARSAPAVAGLQSPPAGGRRRAAHSEGTAG